MGWSQGRGATKEETGKENKRRGKVMARKRMLATISDMEARPREEDLATSSGVRRQGRNELEIPFVSCLMYVPGGC